MRAIFDLLRVALCEHASREVDAVFQAHTNVAPEDRALGHEWRLMPSRGQHRPYVLVPEQPVGGTLHV